MELAVADGSRSVGFCFLRMAVCNVRSEDNSGELAQAGSFGRGRNRNRFDELVGKETEEGYVNKRISLSVPGHIARASF